METVDTRSVDRLEELVAGGNVIFVLCFNSGKRTSAVGVVCINRSEITVSVRIGYITGAVLRYTDIGVSFIPLVVAAEYIAGILG
ncbi:MAG: hypothetical protein KBS44_07560 [Clostridiales bacterium]|nr:hypothetical protein [Candidatus Coliplasma equi]